MSVDEAARHQLYTRLEATLGPEPTSTLMSLLPPVGWADVATKQDLTVLENGLRAEMADLRGELRTEMAELRGDMRTEFAAVRTEMTALRSDLTTAMRTQLFSLIGAMFTLAGLTWAATAIA